MNTPSAPTMARSFSDLGVPRALVDVLDRQGIKAPFDIQLATIPDAMAGRDVLGRAPTGSGKTLAFGIPMIANLGAGSPRRPRGLILSPTRELAEQIRRELQPLASAKGRTLLAIYGGVGFGEQLKGLRQGADVLVACPGRLQDLLSRGDVSLADVDSVVIDEADRMADMGFLPAVRQLLDLTSAKRQTVLFSATLDKEVAILTKHYQNNPVTHQVGEVEPDLTAVTHRFILTEKEGKIRLGADVIDEHGPTIVFCRTRHGVDRVARQLKKVGVKAGWIHGGRSQNQRDAALQAFTNGKVQALIATDVAARGIHVDGVGCVIHYDPPADPKDYVHRSGRTARAGAAGVVVSFVNNDQKKVVAKLIRDVGLPPADFEAMPALSEREVLPWVDERPNGGRKPKGANRPRSGDPKRSGNTNDRGGSKPKSNGGAKADRRAGSNEDWGVSSNRDVDAAGERAAKRRPKRSKKTTASGAGVPAKADPGPKRSGKPRPKNKRSTGPKRSSH